jgi:UDP-N-acetylmuramyl pentapeptide phosphotransferase/UDP-N-acetylglucosamine-1-phosphate transferase
VAAAGVRLVYAGFERCARSTVPWRAGQQPWARTNYRGRPVSLLAGPALATAALATVAFDRASPGRVRAAALVAGAAAAIAGVYDDLHGSDSARGVRGHLAALGRGDLTTGAVKVAAIGLGGLAAGCLAEPGRPWRKLAAGVAVAASANFANLLDVRPGRASKVGLLVAVPLALSGRRGSAVAAATGGAAIGLLPLDLGERVMLGDAGANTLGALVGVALVADGGLRRLPIAVAILVGLTATSEVVSFSRAIDSSRPLRWFDRLGRQPGGSTGSASAVAEPVRE